MNPDVDTIRWEGETDGHLSLIDQTLLPTELKRIACRDVETVWEAIKMLRVRGAPAIGIAAAYGVCVGLQTTADKSPAEFQTRLAEVAGRCWLDDCARTALHFCCEGGT